jgi:hypothetical protein
MQSPLKNSDAWVLRKSRSNNVIDVVHIVYVFRENSEEICLNGEMHQVGETRDCMGSRSPESWPIQELSIVERERPDMAAVCEKVPPYPVIVLIMNLVGHVHVVAGSAVTMVIVLLLAFILCVGVV